MVVEALTTTGPPLESVDVPAGSDPFVPTQSSTSDAPVEDKPPTSFFGGTRKTRQRRATGPSIDKPEKSFSELKTGLEQLYIFASLALMPFDPTCATVIANSAGPASDAFIVLARENKAVRRFLGILTQGSAVGGVIAANTPILVSVATHHFTPRRPPAEVVNLHDNIRHTGANDGSIGKFCPECRNPVIPGVRHTCPEGA